MGTIIVCDGGCGAQSPDPKTRLHDANHWLRIRAAKNLDFERRWKGDDLLFCDACKPRVIAALAPLTQDQPHD